MHKHCSIGTVVTPRRSELCWLDRKICANRLAYMKGCMLQLPCDNQRCSTVVAAMPRHAS